MRPDQSSMKFKSSMASRTPRDVDGVGRAGCRRQGRRAFSSGQQISPRPMRWTAQRGAGLAALPSSPARSLSEFHHGHL